MATKRGVISKNVENEREKGLKVKYM